VRMFLSIMNSSIKTAIFLTFIFYKKMYSKLFPQKEVITPYVCLSTFETNSYPKWLWNHQTTRNILTNPQAVVLTIHHIMDLAFIEFSVSSIFAFIKASLLSNPFFIEVRTTNPIIMKPIVIQSNKSTFYNLPFLWITFLSIFFILLSCPVKMPCLLVEANAE